MKKRILALLTAIIALAFSSNANAQGSARVILEAHDVWGDGGGVQMLLDKDHNLYDSGLIPFGDEYLDNPPSTMYSEFEYMIPRNAEPDCDTHNFIFDGEGYVDIPAGIYDYAIINPTPGDRLYNMMNDNGNADGTANDFEFESGKTYRFKCTQTDGNGSVELTITTEPIEYDLSIAGVKVTNNNCGSLNTIDGVSGNVTYDPGTKTLTLQDATITSNDNDGITSEIDGLKIETKGNVNVTSESYYGLFLDKNSTIYGPGKLIAYGYCGILAHNLKIFKTYVNAEGLYGITTYDEDPGDLFIYDSKVLAKGFEASISNFLSFKLKKCAILAPTGAVWNNEKKALYDASGNIITDVVDIQDLESTVMLDYTPYKIKSHEYVDHKNGNFMLHLYLSENKMNKILLAGNKSFHIGKVIDLTVKEPGNGGFSWEVYVSNPDKLLFDSYGKEGTSSPVFTTGTMRIDGDPAGNFYVEIEDGSIIDTNNGDGKRHTISLYYNNDFIPAAISQPMISEKRIEAKGTYNMAGQRVNDSYKGLVIKNGRKVLNK